MYHSVKDLFDYKIKAEDGEIGSVHDVLFDDRAWIVRYFGVDTGGWLLGRKVLVAPVAALEPDDAAKLLPVRLTRDQVKESPDLAADLPLSRDQEIAYNDYFRWPYYWGGADLVGTATMTGAEATAMLVGHTEVTPTEPTIPPEQRDMTLRSAREIFHYSVRHESNEIGSVEDFILDPISWTIPGIVLKLTAHSDGKLVYVPSNKVTLGWPDKYVDVGFPVGTLFDAPDYDPRNPHDQAAIDRVMEHYARLV
jgi:hypothetical protein